MGLLASSEVWPAIAKLSCGSGRRWCAVAYVTDARVIALRSRDRLVLNASDESVVGGATSAAELRRLLDLGVLMYSVRNLHAKLYIFDSEFVVASCNLSASSQNTLIEAAFHSKDEKEVTAAEKLFEELVACGEVIDEGFVRRIAALPVAQPSLPMGFNAVAPRLWRLKRPPSVAVSAEMKCYMQALFEAQMGGLLEGVEFRLWPGPNGTEAFRAHMLPKADRLRGGSGTYSLTAEGVAHFGKRKFNLTTVAQFLAAIRSGDSSDLPASISDRELVPL